MLLRGAPRSITKKYHQLLFAKTENENEVIASIKETRLDSAQDISNNELKEEYVGNYMEGLEVIDALKYQKDGGEIVSFEFQDINGAKVNLVSSGFNGLIKLVVRFDAPFKDVILDSI